MYEKDRDMEPNSELTIASFFFFFLNFYSFIYLFIYGCVGSSFLCEDFL